MQKEKNTLDRFMELYAKDRTVFVGAASGYLFIGDLETYKRDIKSLDAQAKDALEKRTRLVAKLVEEVNKLIREENERGDGTKFPIIEEKLSEIKAGISERRVVESYQKILRGVEAGTACIISGNEHGKYWLKSEYDALNKNVEE